MGPTRLKVNRLLTSFKRMDTDQKLLAVYREILENKYSYQLDLEDAEWRDSTAEEIEEILSELLSKRIAELQFTNQESLFLLKSTGIIDALSQKFVTNSKVSKVIALFVRKSAKKIEVELNERRNNGDYCLASSEEEEFRAKMDSLKSQGMPAALIQHFVNWNNENKGQS